MAVPKVFKEVFPVFQKTCKISGHPCIDFLLQFFIFCKPFKKAVIALSKGAPYFASGINDGIRQIPHLLLNKADIFRFFSFNKALQQTAEPPPVPVFLPGALIEPSYFCLGKAVLKEAFHFFRKYLGKYLFSFIVFQCVKSKNDTACPVFFLNNTFSFPKKQLPKLAFIHGKNAAAAGRFQ